MPELGIYVKERNIPIESMWSDLSNIVSQYYTEVCEIKTNKNLDNIKGWASSSREFSNAMDQLILESCDPNVLEASKDLGGLFVCDKDMTLENKMHPCSVRFVEGRITGWNPTSVRSLP